MAAIHPQLQNDCIYLGRFDLCHLLLANDSHYPWYILVPDREDVCEIYQLEVTDRRLLQDESCAFSEWLMREFKGEKLNVAALGNQVPQLHLHHIVRYASDPAWPWPVWGKHPALPYSGAALEEIRAQLETVDFAGFASATDPG